MNRKDFLFKLKWFVREHLLFCNSPLKDEVMLEYKLPEEYGDFAVHPCVRYIECGIGGYQWWMVLSPYPNYDTSKENVLLFRGDSEHKDTPPVKWKYVKEVCGTHQKGFNSDPNLYYDGKELWVVWRECETENLPEGVPICCTMCTKTTDSIQFTEHHIIAHNEFDQEDGRGDSSMCPILVNYGGKLKMYASNYVYKPNLKPLGTSRYNYDENGKMFKLEGVYKSDSEYFDLWHFDMFECNGYLYQIITGQFGNAIYLGRSKDGIVFKYSKKPLYSYPWFIKKNFFYKPTAQVFDDKLYVFFPRKKRGKALRIVMRSMSAKELDFFFE